MVAVPDDGLAVLEERGIDDVPLVEGGAARGPAGEALLEGAVLDFLGSLGDRLAPGDGGIALASSRGRGALLVAAGEDEGPRG